MTDFAERVEAFLGAVFVLEPIFATHVGNHAYDDAWPDVSAAGRRRRQAFTDEWSAIFSAFGNDELSADERIDRDVLLGELESQRFADSRLREEAWSPMWWVYL